MNGNQQKNNVFQPGQNEVNKMKENLAKLYNLTEEEKSEEGLLQSRIEEQSNLIMMLKKRADEYLIRCQSLDRENKELESKLSSISDKNKADDKKSRVIFQNYNKLQVTYEDLKSQFEGMKSSNKELKSEIDNLKNEISSLTEKLGNSADIGIYEKDMKILKQKNSQLEKKIQNLKETYSQELSDKRQDIKVKQEIIDSQTRNITEMEEKLNDQRVSSQLSIEQLKNENNLSLNEIRTLKKQLDSQTTTIKRNKDDMTELTRKAKNYENLYKELKEKYQREAESVNSNAQIIKLKADIQIEQAKFHELRQDYDAYKVHSGKLLQTEKELNSRLRKLYS